MSRAADRDNEAPKLCFRHRPVPSRTLGDKLVVARPLDGAPVVLAPTAAIVWRALDDWTTEDAIDLRLAETFPTIAKADRLDAQAQIFTALKNDDLLEHS